MIECICWLTAVYRIWNYCSAHSFRISFTIRSRLKLPEFTIKQYRNRTIFKNEIQREARKQADKEDYGVK